MFAQRGEVMDVQKQDDLIKEAFEIEAEEIGFCLDQLWGDYENPYENSDTALAFNLFKKGWLAKAQAVPEGFVLVPKEPTDKTIARMINTPIEVNLLCDHADIFLSEGEAYIAYQAMIEAQEPAND